MRWGIATDLNMRRWNPDSKPLIVLGTVYDAFSLGRWLRNCISENYRIGDRKLEFATRVQDGLLDLYLYQKEAREELALLTAAGTSNTELEELISRGQNFADFIQNQLRAFERLSKKDLRGHRPSERFFIEGFLGFRNQPQWDGLELLLEELETWARDYKALEQILYERGRYEP